MKQTTSISKSNMKAKDTRKKIQKKRTPGGNKKAHKGNAPEACRLASRAGGVQHRAKITEPPTKKSSDAKGRAKKAVKETNGKRQNETRKREGKENGEQQQGKEKKRKRRRGKRARVPGWWFWLFSQSWTFFYSRKGTESFVWFS